MTRETLSIVVVTIALFLILPAARASEDQVKVRYLPGYIMTGYPVEIVIRDSYKGGNPLIRNVYRKLAILKKRGRLEYAWPDAASITIEVKLKGKVLASTISPNQSAETKEFRDFATTWNEAYALIWEAIRPRLAPKHQEIQSP